MKQGALRLKAKEHASAQGLFEKGLGLEHEAIRASPGNPEYTKRFREDSRAFADALAELRDAGPLEAYAERLAALPSPKEEDLLFAAELLERGAALAERKQETEKESTKQKQLLSRAAELRRLAAGIEKSAGQKTKGQGTDTFWKDDPSLERKK